ncbi:hypothetical protein [Trichocoleus sp. DQ-U1]|uniref:hypothetical protein n=1 Tax=Trichocoleus sp. DQ-U1 TaxID=2933926 RepID=UPI0032984DBC
MNQEQLNVESIEEELRNFPQYDLFKFTLEEWNRIFARFTEFLGHQNEKIRELAVEKIVAAIWSESSQKYRQDNFVPEAIAQRIAPILSAIAYQENQTPGLVEDFCYNAQRLPRYDNYHELILQWLNDLAENKQCESLSAETILTCQIRFDFYGCIWKEAQLNLLAALDHPHPSVRASAAQKIGEFYKDGDPDMPPINEIMQLIKDKEIERPGIAGPFFWPISFDFQNIQQSYETQIDVCQWILDILENRKSSAPNLKLKHFGVSIDFQAHQFLCHNPSHIQHLIKIGRFDIAVAAATEWQGKIEALESILIDLGNTNDPETVRLASWHLAYYYHRLHPKGEEMNFVKLISELADIDIFLNFSSDSKTPFAAIIYPKDDNKLMNNQTAWRWINKIFPESVRGKVVPSTWDNYNLENEVTYRYQYGCIQFRGSVEQKEWQNVTIADYGNFWNPIKLLELPN